MSDDGILSRAKELAAQNRYEIIGHTRLRMRQRGGMRDQDVLDAVLSAKSKRPGEKSGRWVLMGGKDRDGDMLDVVIEIHDDLVIITIF